MRKTYCFSKDWQVHEAMTYFTMYSYNFCWPVRTLRKKGEGEHYEPQTPAMVAGLTDHVWTIQEWATYPARKSIRDKQGGFMATTQLRHHPIIWTGVNSNRFP